MKPICVMCGRYTTPFAFIGTEPVGPNCARKLGLTKKAVKTAKGGRLRLAGKYAAAPKQALPTSLELFPEDNHGPA